MATNKTYTFANSQPADATQVNKNFDDLLAGINAGVSATDKVLGRATAGAGPVEEIACTAAGRAILDDANAAAQRATLGLDADIATLALPANTTISAAGAELINDANAAAQLVTLGLTATAAELNALDGIAPTVTELNYVDGVTSAIQTQLNATVARSTISAAGAELINDANAAAQLVTLGVTATAAELNKLDGITATTAELNTTNGVTSGIQGQLNEKPAISVGASAPTTTPGKAGDIFINAAGGKVYIARQATSSADWLLLN